MSGSGSRAPSRDWDASTYDRVADAQEQWGKEVIERLALSGDETVLDAGCGSGRVTRLLVERLPRGRVIGIDASPSMIERARQNLADGVELVVANLLDLDVEEAVDAVFSNATFHWIVDHDLLFARLFAALRPGGRLVAQCGGEGNVASFRAAARSVGARPPFIEHLADWSEPNLFASAEETEVRLRDAGFTEVSCWLEPKLYRPADPRGFLSSVCLGGPLQRLPEDLRDGFVDAVLEEMAPLELDYVRLNISALRPA
jgi:trans-aconitate 2-methyltransferase